MASLAPTSAFLSASTISTQSHDSSSILQNVDLSIVEEIIDRSPRNASSFPLVYRAYGEVLQEHDIPPSSDTAYYQFLLKLGVIRAPTWGEKWDLYKATHNITPRSPIKKRVITTRCHARLDSQSTKARVPFLATASSDLDYGFTPKSEDEDGNEAGDLSLLETPDSRSRPSKSMVGYSPFESMDYDQITLDPRPFRTSTPVQAQFTGYRHHVNDDSPPLPPYSVSDISESLVPDDSLSQRDDKEGTATPKARCDTLDDVSIDVLDWEMMQARADAFYQTGLLGRCWDVWRQSHQWVEQTTNQIDTVRSNILLRQTLHHWRAACDRALNLASTADAHLAISKQRKILTMWLEKTKERDMSRKEQRYVDEKERGRLEKAFRQWRVRVNERRMKRWEKDISKREKAFTKRRNHDLLESTFQTWRESTQTRIRNSTADEFRFERDMGKALNTWLKRTILQRQLASLAEEWEVDHMQTTLRLWRWKTQMRERERICSERTEDALMGRIWDDWRLKSVRQRDAKLLNERRILNSAFDSWKRHRNQQRVLVEMANKHHQQTMMRRVWTTWVRAERCQLYLRVRDVRVTENAWEQWKRRWQSIEQLNLRGQTFGDQLLRSKLRTSLRRWHEATARHDQLRVQAEDFDHSAQAVKLSGALQKWTLAAVNVKTNQLRADKARSFFLLRSTMAKWKRALTRQRQAQFREERRLADIRHAFDRWRIQTVKRLEYREKVSLIQRKSDTALMRHALDHWTKRVFEIKSRQHKVMLRRNYQIKREMMTRWKMAFEKTKRSSDLMQSFIDVKNEDTVRDTFSIWRHAANRSKDLRRKAEESIAQHQADLLAGSIAIWRGRLKERRLEPIATQVEEMIEDGLMFAVWDRWVSKSTKLPYIAFTKKRILRAAWERWQYALEMAEKEKSVVIPQDQRLLSEVLTRWREKAARKIALTRRRRGRQRSSTPHQNDVTEMSLHRSRLIRSSENFSERSVSNPQIRSLTNEERPVRRVSFGQAIENRSSRRDSAGSDLVRQLRGTLNR